jgi:hypothetical protein
MKNELLDIEKILNLLKSRIDAHVKFKKEYDKQLAFDFSLFQFFSIGENKISEVLAYFLDVNQNHGQGDLFLKEFVKTFYGEEIKITQLENVCEKVISKKRRIDIYIKLKGLTLAIENKIWADDQNNQLKDYSQFLERNSQGNYLLLYLNPYGLEPKSKSIGDNLKETLVKQNKLKVIGYKQDIIPLINNWLINCEADNVSHFLKEFKKYLEVKFLGKNTLKMSKEIREIIYNNEREVQELVNEYKKMENDVLTKLNTVGKELDKIVPNVDAEIEISKSGLFNWEGGRVYKYSVSRNENKIWVQFVQKDIHLYSNYYLQEGTDAIINDILKGLSINQHLQINHELSKAELVDIFLSQVNIANNCLRKYDDQLGIE